MKLAIDTAEIGARFSPGWRQPGGTTVAEDLDISAIFARLRDMPLADDAEKRVAAAAGLLAPAFANMSARNSLGSKLEGLISSWWSSDPIEDLLSHLVVAISLKNASSGRCVAWALRRSLPLFTIECSAETKILLATILKLALYYYREADLEADLFDLRDVFREAKNVSFPLLAEIGARLVARNRNGTYPVEPREMIQTLFAPSRTALVPSTQLEDGVHTVVADKTAAEWKAILPSLYFEPSASSSEFAIACKTFLQHCFGDEKPALLLLLFAKGERTLLVRTIDLGGANVSHDDRMRLIQTTGVTAPEIPDDDGGLVSGDFLERVANARSNSRTWIVRSFNNVVPLIRKREA